MKARALKTGLVPGCSIMYHEGHEYEVVEIDKDTESKINLCIKIESYSEYRNKKFNMWVSKDDFEILED